MACVYRLIVHEETERRSPAQPQQARRRRGANREKAFGAQIKTEANTKSDETRRKKQGPGTSSGTDESRAWTFGISRKKEQRPDRR